MKDFKVIRESIIDISDDKEIRLTQEVISQLRPGDIIKSGFEEGHHSENNGWDDHYYFMAIRERPETKFEREKKAKQ